VGDSLWWGFIGILVRCGNVATIEHVFKRVRCGSSAQSTTVSGTLDLQNIYGGCIPGIELFAVL
jgi:hypothetical protein